MIRKLTARDARLSSFRYYDLLVHVFVVILLISNLVGQKNPGIEEGRLNIAKSSWFPGFQISGPILQ